MNTGACFTPGRGHFGKIGCIPGPFSTLPATCVSCAAARTVLLLGCLLFCTHARGDNIVGTVSTVAGVPVPGVTVSASRIPPDGKPHIDVTDAAGAYVI